MSEKNYQYYCDEDIDLMELYPRTNKERKLFLKLLNQLANLFSCDGDLIELKTKPYITRTGILRSEAEMIPMRPGLYVVDFEERGINEVVKEKAFVNEERRIRISFKSILSIKVIKEGDERFSEEEIEQYLQKTRAYQSNPKKKLTIGQ